MLRNLAKLPTFDGESSRLNVVIESPRGAGAKFDYDPERDLFELSYVMPKGMALPFDFGFVPSTLAADGDPLDIIVLVDVSTFVGCLMTARPVGVIEANQTQDGKTCVWRIADSGRN
jgi:inorganic pyrophosphatase